ncbi:MAG: lysine--tRNA ligase [Alphaproteobacteria bacterium]|nr:lysine--tRNA ligase [Alphaproteobacteria bacterium]
MLVDTAASKAWPFQEAARLIERFKAGPPGKGFCLFETGYGPSGLPHIGTFGEVARTTMVRHAFTKLSDIPTRLFAFSDDMDGLRKVPDNVPNKEMLERHIGKPLTAVPDPFGTHESFGAHNNARLRAFLDAFDFAYEFKSATECYRSGLFDETLLKVLRQYDQVKNVITPTIGPERRATYSPFLPVCPRTGRVLQVPTVERRVDAGTIVYRDENEVLVEVPVTGGHCKLQWKVDWAMRWTALGVDYEMAGKDLIDSAKLSSQICLILGSPPPEGFIYELFLDDKGEKISKSRGNGLTIEEWLTYASPESLALYMYQAPRKAKRLHFDVIPRAVDEYVGLLARSAGEDEAARRDNPVWHIHAGHPPAEQMPVTFGLLLNLVSVCNTEDQTVLWGFISRYIAGATPERYPLLDRLIGYALRYYRDFVKPAKTYRPASDGERAALLDLAATLARLPNDATAEAIQSEIYEVGKRHAFANLRDWFAAMYEVLFGQKEGPRMGSFVALYGVDNFVTLIRDTLAGHSAAAE